MTLTSRRKRILNRKNQPLRDASLILIFSEGEKTEKLYFESEIFMNKRVQVKVFETKDSHSAPIYVLNRLKEELKNIQLESNDQIWLMCDKDRWPDEQLVFVCSHAIRGKKTKAKLAISNPSFELWLYLHFEKWTNGEVSSKDIENVLRKKIGSYNKSNLDINLFVDKIATAIDNAEKLDTLPKNRWPNNPGTHVYRVVRAIKNLMQ